MACMYSKGNLRLGGAIGMAMFVQMWYWFPLIRPNPTLMLLLSLLRVPAVLP